MKKLKQKLLLFALLGASTGGLVLSVVSPIQANAWSWLVDKVSVILMTAIMDILTFILGAIAAVVTWIGNLLLSAVFNSDPNFLLNSAVTGNVWSKILLLTNGIYLLILVAASIAIIVRVNVGAYNIKKILGSLVTAIALSNLSLLIVKVLVEFSDQITNSFMALFGIPGVEGLRTFLGGLLSETQPFKYLLTANGLELIIAWIAFILIVIIILKLAIILLERMIWIFGLTVVAPLAFALSVLPNMQSYSKQWWEKLIKWIMVLPATIGVTCLAIYVMTAGKFDSNSVNTISNQIVNISSLFRNNEGLTVINPDLIMIIAGLAILYLAGEVGKSMKLGAASGTVFKGIGDTFAGKNAVGKLAKDTWHNEAYPRLMQSDKKILGKTPAEWEGKRFANVRGPIARITNPEGWKKVRKLDTQAHVDKATMGEQARNVKKLAAQKQGYEDLKKEKDSFLKQYSVNNGQLFDATGNAAPLQDQQRYNEVNKQIATGAAKYKTTNDKYKQEMAGLAWKVRDVNKSTTIDQIPDYDTLKADIEKAHAEGELAKELSGFEQMSRIARTKNHPDSADAANFMGGQIAERMFEEIGVNKEVFRSRAKPAQMLKSSREDVPQNTHKDYILAKEELQTKRYDFVVKHRDILPNNITAANVDTKLNIINEANSLHQSIAEQVGLTNSTNGHSLSELISKVESARAQQQNANIKNDDQAIANAVIAAGSLNPTDTDSLDKIKQLNKLFNIKGANAERIYTKINAKPTVRNTADLVRELNIVLQDASEVRDIKQEVSILEKDIEVDNKSHQPNYEFQIRTKIKEQIDANQAAGNPPVTNIELVQQYTAQQRTANDAIDVALKQTNINSTDNAKTTLDNLHQSGAITVNFDQIKQGLEKSGIGPITQNAWNNLSIEDAKNYVNRTLFALNNFNQSPKGKK